VSAVQPAVVPNVFTANPILVGVHAMRSAVRSNSPTVQGKRSDVDYAMELVNGLLEGRLVAFSGQFWVFRGGYWRAVDPLREIVSKIVGLMGEEATATKAKRVLEMVRILYSVDAEEFERRGNLLCVKNGTLDVLTRTLLRHDPDNRLTTGLDIDYDPTATCPTFDRILQDIFGSDPDGAQKISFFQEWIGYILTNDTSLHKFLWMVGGGANGKSTLLNVFKGYPFSSKSLNFVTLVAFPLPLGM